MVSKKWAILQRDFVISFEETTATLPIGLLELSKPSDSRISDFSISASSARDYMCHLYCLTLVSNIQFPARENSKLNIPGVIVICELGNEIVQTDRIVN
jgi:hypothetical protein